MKFKIYKINISELQSKISKYYIIETIIKIKKNHISFFSINFKCGIIKILESIGW